MKKKNYLLLLVMFFLFSLNLSAQENDKLMHSDDFELIANYDNRVPENIEVNIKYNKYPNILDYVFVATRVANLRSTPDTSSPKNIIGKYTYDVKLKLLKKIKYKGNFWYYVEDNRGKKGYMAVSVTAKRIFRFEMALEKIKELENFINDSLSNSYRMGSINSYSPNPNHVNLSWDKDKYGTSIDQNLIGYHGNEKIIVPDRSIVKILKINGDKALIKALSIPEELIIPRSKISSYPNIKKMVDKVITIDLKNQNLMVFEKDDSGIWTLISYVYSKTGMDSQLGFQTPKGFFSVPTVKYVMAYNDENGQKQGAARFATRFSGGGYLHGTPINEQEEINREFFMQQKEFTLGTFSGTRKCVRTTEGHARFLFDWIVKSPNKNANMQRPTDNVYFIIF